MTFELFKVFQSETRLRFGYIESEDGNQSMRKEHGPYRRSQRAGMDRESLVECHEKIPHRYNIRLQVLHPPNDRFQEVLEYSMHHFADKSSHYNEEVLRSVPNLEKHLQLQMK